MESEAVPEDCGISFGFGQRQDVAARGGILRCSLCESNKGSVVLLGRVWVSIWR